jgi:hypothetical protein
MFQLKLESSLFFIAKRIKIKVAPLPKNNNNNKTPQKTTCIENDRLANSIQLACLWKFCISSILSLQIKKMILFIQCMLQYYCQRKAVLLAVKCSTFSREI